ncbi:MAG: (2Fe-2S)-binding protein [Elusimicrobia bacterium]|nr:(2Fe-2S)-binding protein [Elusimicrobiota bacterium]
MRVYKQELFKIQCVVNGRRIRKTIPSNITLLEFIRDFLDLKGAKQGCLEGECGACMVLVDAKAVNSCLMMAVHVHGKEITTIEGIPLNPPLTKGDGKGDLEGMSANLHPLQKSFIEEGAVQCGFCTPGFIISARALLKKNPKASVSEIKKSLTSNLCRCTGYEKIIKAVDKAKKCNW